MSFLSLFLVCKSVTVRMIVSVDAETLRHRLPGILVALHSGVKRGTASQEAVLGARVH